MVVLSIISRSLAYQDVGNAAVPRHKYVTELFFSPPDRHDDVETGDRVTLTGNGHESHRGDVIAADYELLELRFGHECRR